MVSNLAKLVWTGPDQFGLDWFRLEFAGFDCTGVFILNPSCLVLFSLFMVQLCLYSFVLFAPK